MVFIGLLIKVIYWDCQCLKDLNLDQWE
uniref:Uncharacterized protein n=1 Tax=Arundo donax TaxID=35708 RepID=A0A0A9A9C9_ARUDO